MNELSKCWHKNIGFHSISPYPSSVHFSRSEPLGTLQIFTASIKNQFPYRFENNAVETEDGRRYGEQVEVT